MAEPSDQSLRRTAREIFEHVENNAHEELRRSTQALAFSGFAGGLSMGLTGLSVSAALAALGIRQATNSWPIPCTPSGLSL